MPISIACPHCAAKFRVSDAFAGRRGACPKCRGAIEVPQAPSPSSDAEPTAPAAATMDPPDEESNAYEVAPLEPAAPALPLQPTITADADGALRMEFIGRSPKPSPKVKPKPPRELRIADLASAFQGRVGRLRPGLGYQLGLVLAALVMVLIPLVYAALVAGAGYSVYLWATEMVWLLQLTRFGAALYLIGCLGLAVATLFLLKPLVRWERRGAERLAVHRAEEPLLFAFVDRVCESVRARKPRRIELVCDATAFVRFRNPLASMLTGNIVLGIGLPLLGGLRIDHLGGVIAHELGHANQFVGMRLHGLVMHVFLWVQRQVYERDVFDETIDDWMTSDGYVAPLFGWAAAAGVALSRAALYLLLPLALAVARFLSRRQEFDADRYTIRLIGSQGFCAAHRSIMLLNVGHAAAMQALGASLERGDYPGHLPGLVVDLSRQLMGHGVVPPKPEEMSLERSRLFDTHPADAARMQRALEEQAEPLLMLNRPARDLLSDFNTLSEAATRRFLRDLWTSEDDD